MRRMRITRFDVGKASLVTIGVGMATLGYTQIEGGKLKVGIIMVALGLLCVLIGLALKEE